MQTFVVAKDGFKKIRKKILLRSLILYCIVMTATVLIVTFGPAGADFTFGIWAIVAPVVAFALFFGIYRGIKRQKKLLSSYCLTISNNLISREQLDTPTVSMYFSEVKEIARLKSGAFVITGLQSDQQIFIPSLVDNHAELLQALQHIRPVTGASKHVARQWLHLLFSIVNISMMVCVYTATNKIVVAIAAMIFVAISVWGLVRVRTNQNVDRKTKGRLWLSILILGAVVLFAISKLTPLVEWLEYALARTLR